MKKTSINISFDDEKLAAIRLYMSKKGVELDEELAGQLEKLYEKFVPANVRNFITERYVECDPARKKPDGP